MKKIIILTLLFASVQSFAQNDFKGVNIIRDTLKLYKQAQYQANYGSTFNIRSLIDKGYVDSAIAANVGGSTPTLDDVLAAGGISAHDATVGNLTTTTNVNAGNATISSNWTGIGNYGRFIETGSISTPASGYGVLYAKTDKTLHFKTSDGVDLNLSGNAGTVDVDVATGPTSHGLSSASSYYQIYNGTSTGTYSLPVVSGNTGMTLVFKNTGSGTLTINSFSGGNDIFTTSAVSTLSLSTGQSAILANTGSYWAKMN